MKFIKEIDNIYRLKVPFQDLYRCLLTACGIPYEYKTKIE